MWVCHKCNAPLETGPANETSGPVGMSPCSDLACLLDITVCVTVSDVTVDSR